jgi:hypothetical protein
LRKIQAKTGEMADAPFRRGQDGGRRTLPPAAAVEPDTESVNCFNRGSVPLVSLRRPHIAADYWLRGFLWNSFVMVAEVGELLDLFAKMTPQLYSSFAEIMPVLDTSLEGNAIAKPYASISSGNFSEASLAGCSSDLSVLPATGVDWNDLGEPSCVIATLEKIGRRPRYLVAS